MLLLVLAGLGLVSERSWAADGIAAQRVRLEVRENALAVSSRYRIVLPDSLQNAVMQGVPLSFQLQFDLTRPRSAASWNSLSNWFAPTASMQFKLAYYGLTGRYRVTIGGLSKYYPGLDEALAAVGSIAGWRVLDTVAWDDADRRKAAGKVRLMLDISQLPRPFQLRAVGADDWELDSGWHEVIVAEEG